MVELWKYDVHGDATSVWVNPNNVEFVRTNGIQDGKMTCVVGLISGLTLCIVGDPEQTSRKFIHRIHREEGA